MVYKKILFWIWLLVIAFLSLSPNQERIISSNHFDKVLHFGAYFVTMLMLILAYPYIKYKAIVYLFFYGFAIEIGQIFVKNRFFETLDLVANLLGALVAYLLIQWLKRVKNAKT